jgi:predicted hydrocarbon binding protein
MAEEAKGISTWCSAARTYEAQVIDKDITQTYTHCLAKGDSICRFVIEKSKA